MKRFAFALLALTVLCVSASAFAADKAPAAPTPAPAADAKGAASVDAVLEKYVKAIGGREAWNKVETRQMKAELEAQGATSEWTLDAKAPNKRMTRVELPGIGLFQDGFDGKVAWQKTQNGVTVKTGDDLARAKNEADFHREIRLKELYPDLTARGAEQFNGETVQVLESHPTKTSKVRLSFSDKSGLLTRIQSDFQTVDGNELTIESALSDYRAVDGLQIPHQQKIQILAAGQPVFDFTLKVKEIKHNQKIDDAKFAKPGE